MGVLVAYNKVDYLYGFTEIVKILIPLTDNPNAPYRCGITPINCEARRGIHKLVKSSPL